MREDPPAAVPVLTLEGLDGVSARALLARHAGDLAPVVADELAATAAGNPLALIELPAMLSPDQRAGRAPRPDPPVPGREVGRAFAGRIDALPAPARTALLTVVAEGSGDLVPVARALAALGVDAGALERVEEARLLAIASERVTLAHPLVAAVAYHSAAPAERRRVHAALAPALGAQRGAWHLAAAAAGPSAEAAEALDHVAADAAARRAHATAAAALERAARLSPDDDGRAQRLLGAGSAALFAGHGAQAAALLGEAAVLAAHPALRLQAEFLRGHAEMWSGDVVKAGASLEHAAEGLAAADPTLAAGALADASMAAAATGDCREALRRAERAAALLGDGPSDARASVAGVLGWALALRGQVAQARPLLAETERLAASIDPRAPLALTLIMSLNVRILTEDHAGARRQALAMVAALREAGSLSAQPMPLLVAADAALRLGEWDAARIDFDEAVEIADATGQPGVKAHALSMRARLDGAAGRESRARAAVDEALAVAAPSGFGSVVLFAHASLGALELGLGRTEAALAALLEAQRLVEEHGMELATFVNWAPDLVEALVHAGRRDEAGAVATRFEAQARALGTPGALALAERCAGLLASDGGDAHFAAALAHHERSPAVFEQARTLLAHGRRLHRARRRAEAAGACTRRSRPSNASARSRGRPPRTPSCARPAAACAPRATG